MGNKRTRIALVLDSSGSMGSVKDEAIKGFNEAIDDILERSDDGGDTTLSLIVFNGNVEERFLHRNVDAIERLTHLNYKPHGTTALRDAVGHAIESIQSVDDLEDNDAAALVVVVTDGYENASRKWSQNDLAETIQQLENTEKWTFTFMCANVDPTVIEEKFNVHEGNVACFVQNQQGMADMSLTMTSSLGGYMSARKKGTTNVRNFYNEDSKTS